MEIEAPQHETTQQFLYLAIYLNTLATPLQRRFKRTLNKSALNSSDNLILKLLVCWFLFLAAPSFRTKDLQTLALERCAYHPCYELWMTHPPRKTLEKKIVLYFPCSFLTPTELGDNCNRSLDTGKTHPTEKHSTKHMEYFANNAKPGQKTSNLSLLLATLQERRSRLMKPSSVMAIWKQF